MTRWGLAGRRFAGVVPLPARSPGGDTLVDPVSVVQHLLELALELFVEQIFVALYLRLHLLQTPCHPRGGNCTPWPAWERHGLCEMRRLRSRSQGALACAGRARLCDRSVDSTDPRPGDPPSFAFAVQR